MMTHGLGGANHRAEEGGGPSKARRGSLAAKRGTITRSQEEAYGGKALSRAGNRCRTGFRGNHWQEQATTSRYGAGGESSGQRCHRAAAGRNGNGQGVGGAGDPPVEPARRK